ncbi:MAG: glycosyltransferase family 9 protein, partial [Spirochaetia bacterium]|nr:glycosyltransferase family 9 protein [Spirochaetia bacterium]
MEKILVSRTDGIGDLLLTTPLIHELRLKYPQAEIIALVNRYAAPVLENNPDVTSVMLYDKKEHEQAVKVLKNTYFDAVVAVYPRPELAWAFFTAHIPRRIGTSRRWYSFLFNEKVNISRRNPYKHEADYNLDLVARYIGNATASKEYYYMTDRESDNGAAYIAKKLLEKGSFIVVHPGSKGSAWNLSVNRYTELVEKLCAKGRKVLLTGGP